MKQTDINQYVRNEIESAQHVIAQYDEEHPHDPYRDSGIVGALQGALAGMAGLHEYQLNPSCFDAETTEAIKQLLETINQK